MIFAEIISSTDNLNLVYSKMITDVTSLIEKFPYRLKRVKHKKTDWITNDFIALTYKRDKAVKLAQKTKLTSDITFAKNLKNECKKLSKKLKKQYFDTELKNCKQNPKKGWKIINNFLPNKGSNKNCVEKILVDNSPVTNKLDISNHFNSFYIKNIDDAYSKNDFKFPNMYDDFITTLLNASDSEDTTNHFNFHPITNDYTLKLLSSIKAATPGHKSIPYKFIEIILNEFATMLTHLINRCLEEAIFPDSLKQALVTPLHKGGEKEAVTNYRPVSILPNISKIFERVMALGRSNKTIHK